MVKCRLGFLYHCRKYTYTFKIYSHVIAQLLLILLHVSLQATAIFRALQVLQDMFSVLHRLSNISGKLFTCM